MARRKLSVGEAMFAAAQIGWMADEALRNPPAAQKPQPTAQELAAKRAQATTAAYEKEYRDREEKRERESKEAQARGATLELLQHLGATKDEQRELSRCPVSEVPAALADLRRPAPANMEVLEKIYSVLK